MPNDAKLHTLTGNIRRHERFRSRFRVAERDILVYLPPGYDEDTSTRYPVLYMHDGQNLFDSATAFSQEWGVDETAERLIASGEIQPLIVVAIGNGSDARIHEYTPTRDRKEGVGGRAHPYGRMLVEEIKPFIDGEYRTLTDATNTGLAGSSLGALVTMFLGLKYPSIFWRLAVLSPSVWWDERYILRRIQQVSTKPPSRIWL
jgi:predicted alpha/beta superfamily hydrolase